MELIQYPQGNDDRKIARKILSLENTVWPQETEDSCFPSAPSTYVTSFVLMENHTAICHVGLRKSILYHKGEEYLAYGLSEVVTHPHYQKRGLGSRTINAAIQFMIRQRPDISIFTCTKEKVAFYERCGWEAMPDACFVGGTSEKPFRSDQLNLVTMMMFLSTKSKQHREDFEHSDIVFTLGDNQLW